MDTIHACYEGYINSADYQKPCEKGQELSDILAQTAELLPKREYLVLEEAVNQYCNKYEEGAFAAGFRFATKLWTEGLA